MTTHAQQVADLEALTADYFSAPTKRHKLRQVADDKIRDTIKFWENPVDTLKALAQAAGRRAEVVASFDHQITFIEKKWQMGSEVNKFDWCKLFLQRLETMD